MKLGYARVSRDDQNLDLQIDALKKVGCDQIYSDKISGAKQSRHGLDQALSKLSKGDSFVVWKLNRLGRSLKHLVTTVSELREKGVGFVSLTEEINTSTPSGKLIFHIFAALAEFDRDIIRERTFAGLAAAKARGRLGGRPRKISEAQMEILMSAVKQGTLPREICRAFKISMSTYFRAIKDSQDMAAVSSYSTKDQFVEAPTMKRPSKSDRRTVANRRC